MKLYTFHGLRRRLVTNVLLSHVVDLYHFFALGMNVVFMVVIVLFIMLKLIFLTTVLMFIFIYHCEFLYLFILTVYKPKVIRDDPWKNYNEIFLCEVIVILSYSSSSFEWSSFARCKQRLRRSFQTVHIESFWIFLRLIKCWYTIVLFLYARFEVEVFYWD